MGWTESEKLRFVLEWLNTPNDDYAVERKRKEYFARWKELDAIENPSLEILAKGDRVIRDVMDFLGERQRSALQRPRVRVGMRIAMYAKVSVSRPDDAVATVGDGIVERTSRGDLVVVLNRGWNDLHQYPLGCKEGDELPEGFVEVPEIVPSTKTEPCLPWIEQMTFEQLRLRNAAPELLVACKHILKVLHDSGLDKSKVVQFAMGDVEKAIAKAEGRST